MKKTVTIYASMVAKTKAPKTSLIKCTPDITRTQAMIAARTVSKMPMKQKGDPAGEQIKTVNEIINAEKTCLLGNDLPCVSFGMTGGISNFSYGRGRFTIYLKTDTEVKPTSGTMIESASIVPAEKHRYSTYTGYVIKTKKVHILLINSSFRAALLFSRNGAVIFT